MPSHEGVPVLFCARINKLAVMPGLVPGIHVLSAAM